MSALWSGWVGMELRWPRMFWVFFEEYAAEIGCRYSEDYRLEQFNFPLRYICSFTADNKCVRNNVPSLCAC